MREKLVAAFAVGALTGALLALLLTPYTGDETRAKVKEEFERLLDRLTESLGRLENIKENLEEEMLNLEEEV